MDKMKIKVFINKNGLHASGIYDTSDETIYVLKGSRVSNEVASHFKDSIYDSLRSDLIDEKVIVDNVFTRDYSFNRPSPASSVILGSNTNGKREWVTENGKDLNHLGKSNEPNLLKINPQNKIIEEIFKICDQEASHLIASIEKQMIERTTINISDTESMFKDIIALRDKKEKIISNRRSIENVIEVVTKLWNEYQVKVDKNDII